MLDDDSNRLMMRWVENLERHLESIGLRIHIPRRHQEPYHSTLAVVNGTAYPVKKAIQELNKQFLQGSWLDEPLVLRKPCAAHGNITEGFFC